MRQSIRNLIHIISYVFCLQASEQSGRKLAVMRFLWHLAAMTDRKTGEKISLTHPNDDYMCWLGTEKSHRFTEYKLLSWDPWPLTRPWTTFSEPENTLKLSITCCLYCICIFGEQCFTLSIVSRGFSNQQRLGATGLEQNIWRRTWDLSSSISFLNFLEIKRDRRLICTDGWWTNSF